MGRSGFLGVATLAALVFSGASAIAQGVVSPGAGPINRAMAGASVAAPVDFGASYWNPATLSGLERDEVLLGSELLFPSIHLQSRLPAGAIQGVLPTTSRFGTSRSDSGVASNLAVGASWKLTPDSPLTMGLGMFGLVGGNVNFPGSYQVPVLGPRLPPRYFGVGPVYANTLFIEIKPMLSLQATDRLAVAFAPRVLSGSVAFNPAFFAPAERDEYGIASFPPATNGRTFWGGGFEIGLLYEASDAWNVGFAYKSPIWQEKWRFNSYNPDLTPRSIGLQAGVPAIYSWGVAYKGLPGAIVDVDLRYLDYPNTPLYGTAVREGGLNWNGVFAVATGAQYQLSDRITLRGGYLFNTNPINAPQTLFNIQAPAIIEHTLSLGASLRLADHIVVSAAWVHGFRNDVTGSILQVPGSSARLDAQLDSIVAGITIQYGARRRPTPEAMPALATAPAPAPETAAY